MVGREDRTPDEGGGYMGGIMREMIGASRGEVLTVSRECTGLWEDIRVRAADGWEWTGKLLSVSVLIS